MKIISLDMYQTLALAVAVLFLGAFMKKKIHVLEKFCIPAPVVGGLVFAILSCVLYALGIVEFNFDETLKTVCMVMFFTSVGFQANLRVLKSGGLSLLIFLLCVIALIMMQNLTSVGLAKLMGLSPLLGLCTGSIPMVGGHGTAGLWPGVGRSGRQRCPDAVYGGGDLRSDRRLPDGRPSRPSPDPEARSAQDGCLRG